MHKSLGLRDLDITQDRTPPTPSALHRAGVARREQGPPEAAPCKLRSVCTQCEATRSKINRFALCVLGVSHCCEDHSKAP